jgi:hypothetical protein
VSVRGGEQFPASSPDDPPHRPAQRLAVRFSIDGVIDGSLWLLSRPLVAIDIAIDHEKVALRTAR